MVLPLVVLLSQSPSALAGAGSGDLMRLDDRPVRVWLSSAGPLMPGDRVQVYVQTTGDGYLVLLHAGADGRIEVLFPADPAADPYVRAGTYEIRRADVAAAFVAAEPGGVGVVLAALAPTPLRFDEFARAGSWNPDALVASWAGADAEGALLDIVQRMLGDESFNYDVLAYTVAPPALAPTTVAQSGANGPCLACSPVAVVVLIEPVPVFVCDPFLILCQDFFGLFPHRLRQPAFCDLAGFCTDEPPPRNLALNVRPAFHTSVTPPGRRASPYVVPPRPAPPRPIEPRTRTPAVRRAVVVRAIPLRGASPGTTTPPAPVLSGTGRVAVGRALAAARPTRPTRSLGAGEVRLVMPRIPVHTADSDALQTDGQSHAVALVATVPHSGRVIFPGPAPRAAASPSGARAGVGFPVLTMPPRPAVARPVERPTASATTLGVGAAQVIALPRAVWRGGATRVGALARVRRQP